MQFSFVITLSVLLCLTPQLSRHLKQQISSEYQTSQSFQLFSAGHRYRLQRMWGEPNHSCYWCLFPCVMAKAACKSIHLTPFLLRSQSHLHHFLSCLFFMPLVSHLPSGWPTAIQNLQQFHAYCIT